MKIVVETFSLLVQDRVPYRASVARYEHQLKGRIQQKEQRGFSAREKRYQCEQGEHISYVKAHASKIQDITTKNHYDDRTLVVVYLANAGKVEDKVPCEALGGSTTKKSSISRAFKG